MKKNLFVAVLAASSVLASASASRAQSTFPDVPDNHWAAQAVKKLAEAGIIEGYPAAPGAPAKAKPRAAKRARKAPASTSGRSARAAGK